MKRQQVLVHVGATWRAAITLSLYRSAIAFGLVALLSIDAGTTRGLFDPSFADLFRVFCLIYLALAVGLSGTALVGWPRLSAHIFIQIAVDVVILVGLSFAGNGAASGLALLLLAPLAAAGILMPARYAGLLAALAALGLLAQEVERHWQLADAHTDFFQAGILGALYFASTGLAFWLAGRIRASDASAASHASQARDLAELNRRIIDHMQIGAIVVDTENRLQTINNTALHLMDHPDRRAPPTHADALPPALVEAIASWRAGHIVPEIVEIAGRPLQPSFELLAGDETTTLVFVEDARRASHQAQQMKLISLGQLTASIAHQIGNPLGAISHAGQLLAESRNLDNADKRLLAMIHRHSQRIDRIVNDVLGLARRSRQTPQTLSLGPWLQDAITDYQASRADPPQLSFETDAPDAAIRFDPDQLRQVLFNLWDNSNRHARGERAPLIRLRWHMDGNRNMALDIADDGPGIPEALVDRILEPFFTTVDDGTGLGLHIARELCEANNARLLVIAGQSAGACFRVLLPRISTDQPALCA